jgi:precorrin-6B methylase 1
MNEQQYKIWWQLHRRVAVGEQLSEEEQRAYQSGLAELEAEEMAALSPADDEWRAL